MDKGEGLRRHLDDLTQVVKKLQEEIENDGKASVCYGAFILARYSSMAGQATLAV